MMMSATTDIPTNSHRDISNYLVHHRETYTSLWPALRQTTNKPSVQLVVGLAVFCLSCSTQPSCLASQLRIGLVGVLLHALHRSELPTRLQESCASVPEPPWTHADLHVLGRQRRAYVYRRPRHWLYHRLEPLVHYHWRSSIPAFPVAATTRPPMTE